MKDSKIAWTDHTFNPWRGCTKVSAGCANCYAETLSRRNPAVLGEWGPGSARVPAAEAYWHQPIRWSVAARASARAARVFCLSLGDVAEDHANLPSLRARLGKLIRGTWWLDWLLLTKRPERWEAVREELWGSAPPPFNAWLGVSVEDQRAADNRIPHLLAATLHPRAVRFVSFEPALGLVDFMRWTGPESWRRGLDWIIVGGESNGSRPFHVSWARSVVEQGRRSSVPVFVKQLGSHPVNDVGDLHLWGRGKSWPSHVRFDGDARVLLRDRKHGADPEEWPADLRVQQTPCSVAPADRYGLAYGGSSRGATP